MAVAILATAVVQWLVILERAFAVIWEWYKFDGYPAHGAITVGVQSQVLFYFLTAGAITAGLVVVRTSSMGRASNLLGRAIKAGIATLLCGMIVWTGLLVSPLVTFR